MPDDRVRVPRTLYASGLADAIDWQESFLAAHDSGFPGGPSCCKPSARCDGYEQAARLLARYEKARAALSAPRTRNGM